MTPSQDEIPIRIHQSTEASRVKPYLYTYDHQGPIGGIDFGGADITVRSAEQCRLLIAALAELAGQFEAYADTHCPECQGASPGHMMTCSRRTPLSDEAPSGWRDETTGLISGPLPEVLPEPAS